MKITDLSLKSKLAAIVVSEILIGSRRVVFSMIGDSVVRKTMSLPGGSATDDVIGESLVDFVRGHVGLGHIFFVSEIASCRYHMVHKPGGIRSSDDGTLSKIGNRLITVVSSRSLPATDIKPHRVEMTVIDDPSITSTVSFNGSKELIDIVKAFAGGTIGKSEVMQLPTINSIRYFAILIPYNIRVLSSRRGRILDSGEGTGYSDVVSARNKVSELFRSGDVSSAFELYRRTPGSRDDISEAEFIGIMNVAERRHGEDDDSQKRHADLMENGF
jgi:hypothetical protein